MKVIFEKDGSISFRSEKFSFTNGYPKADGIPLRPLQVSVTENSAVYETLNGELQLAVSEDIYGTVLTAAVKGFENTHDISLAGDLKMEGIEQIFIQGLGIGGPTGFRKPEEQFCSDAVFAAGNAEGCAAFYARDHRRFRSYFEGAEGHVDLKFDLEKTLKEETVLPELCIKEGGSFDEVLKACAGEIAETMQARSPKEPAFHWCSWYYLYHNLTQGILEDYLEGFKEYRETAPFKYIQIDAGYFPSCGDWLIPNERFPEGLKHAADTIKAAGFEPGIWVAPFLVGEESALFKEHPDWVIHDLDGKPLVTWKQYNEPKVWGYIDSHYYALDTSHPDAMAYMKHVFETLYGWGFRLFKTDFMLWGLKDSAKVLRHTPGKTSFEYFRELMQVIREAIHDSEWLGCIAPFAPFIGYADRMRIAGDVGAQWADDFGPVNMMQEIYGDQYFNQLYWQNDPDAVLLRDFHIYLKDHEIEALALLQAVSGGVITTSDPVHKIAEDRRALLRMIRPAGVAHPEYPYWQDGKKVNVIVNRLGNGKSTVFLMNPSPDETVFPLEWDRLAPDAAYVYRYHGGSLKKEAVPYVTIPGHSAVLFFASEEELPAEPENLWIW